MRHRNLNYSYALLKSCLEVPLYQSMSAQVILTVTEGKLKGEQFSFNSRDTCIVGRHPDCQIQLPNDEYHSAVSRYHCLLDINPPAIRVRDFGSRHGTYVNGKCIGKREENQTASQGTKLELSQHDLNDGDVITLGNTAFQVKIAQQLESTWIPKATDDILTRHEFDINKNIGSIDKYTKIKKLGEGGFGAVYLARLDDASSRKIVALKTLHSQVAVMPKMKERFLREARNTKMLDHPNIVKFNDFGQADNLFYFTMEYCDRGSVVDLIEKRGGKLEREEATEIILQILDGLHYAHQKGLVHRDIKPANIFLTINKGKILAKLGDYGLAKAFDMAGLSGLSDLGDCMGTPACMPRQQVLDFKYSQPEVDIWAIVATYYFLLTGFFPRNLEDSHNMMVELLTKSAVPIRERDASIPQPLAELIDLALVDNPELHFKNAAAFKQALLSVI